MVAVEDSWWTTRVSEWNNHCRVMSKVSTVASQVVKLSPVPEMEYGWKLHAIKLVRNPSVSVSEFGGSYF